MANMMPPIAHDRCDHPFHLRQQSYPHSWLCTGCCRFFDGEATDNPPQFMTPEQRAVAAEHNRRKTEVARQMIAKGLTPPRVTK